MSKSKLTVILASISAAVIMVVAGFVFGGITPPIPVVPISPSLSLVGEPTRTPTPGRTGTATRTPHAEGTVAATATAVVVSTQTAQATSTGVPSATASPTPTPSSVVVPTSTLAPTSTVLVVSGPTWYVSRSGSNADGRSLASAWNELDQIKWAQVQPGDTILVSAGTYTTSLIPTRGGAPNAPITVLATGPVSIVGGRSTLLPYCDQVGYVYQTVGVRQKGVDVGVSWLTIDGGTWRGIKISGFSQNGIALSVTSSNVTIRNVEVTDNGSATLETRVGNSHYGTWYPDLEGVHPSGTNNTVDRAIIHDNGQDAFQSSGGLANFTISRSWLYNGRVHPSGPDIASNYCRHSDGIQVYAGGVQTGLTIDHSVVGPGLLQGTLLGQSGSQNATINNVTIRDSLFLNAANANMSGYATIASQNWVIDRVTSYINRNTNHAVIGGFNKGIQLEGAGHRITNSIFDDGRVEIPAGTASSGNCTWNLMTGSLGGQNADPRFVAPPASNALADLIAADYTPTGACAGFGSAIHSVAQLLAS